jgi:putative redox protein
LITVKWKGKMSFIARREEGHSLTMDAPPSSGGDGEGFTPVELILAGLGGCTGMDIVTIMQRERQQITGLEVNVTGTKRNELPHYFEAIDVHYVVRGRNITKPALERAIQLSEEKYCSVRAIFRPEVKVTYSYDIAQETPPELNS